MAGSREEPNQIIKDKNVKKSKMREYLLKATGEIYFLKKKYRYIIVTIRSLLFLMLKIVNFNVENNQFHIV